MFLLKLNFFSYSLSLIITLFKLALNYRPQSSSDDLDLLFDDLTSLNPTFLSNLILLGDFNINFYSTSSSKTKLDAVSDTFDLKQINNAPTHFSHTDTPSTIDLVFLPSNIDGLLVVFFLLSLLQTISLFFSPFLLILLTVLPLPSLQCLAIPSRWLWVCSKHNDMVYMENANVQLLHVTCYIV